MEGRESMKEIVEQFTNRKETIATMESCTGGALASAITNVEGASEVLKFSAVTYCNEYKIKMGVNPKVIEKFTVYSKETAMEMSKNISLFADSDVGIGITGKLNRADKRNPSPNDSLVFVSIYDRKKNHYHNVEIKVEEGNTRLQNKNLVVEKVIEALKEIG